MRPKNNFRKIAFILAVTLTLNNGLTAAAFSVPETNFVSEVKENSSESAVIETEENDDIVSENTETEEKDGIISEDTGTEEKDGIISENTETEEKDDIISENTGTEENDGITSENVKTEENDVNVSEETGTEKNDDINPENAETSEKNITISDNTTIPENAATVSNNAATVSDNTSTVSENTVTVSENTISGNELEMGIASVPLSVQEYEPYWQNGNYSNLVVFIDFADTDHGAHEESFLGDCVKDAPELTWNYFNGSETLPRGMRQYLYNISYGQLRVENIFPQYNSATDTFEPYVLKNNASYYAENRDAMIKEIVNAVNNSGQLHPDMKLNLNSGNQKILDNLMIVISCESKNSNKLFSGIATTYFGNESIGGCKVSKYNIVTESGIYYNFSNSGVIIHEFMHTLGYPDLYHQGSGVPVGTWDIMASESTYVQYPLAYTRSHYSNWFTIPELTKSQTGLTLPAASATNNSNKDRQAYILKTDYSDTEFFVVEYRKQGARNTEEYEVKIPGSGLIVYRVDTEQITNFIGPPDMIYIYRPGDNFNSSGYESGSGNIYEAHLSAESGRTSYGSSDFSHSLADGAITYSDGRNSGIVISNVGSAAGNEITFDITFTEPEEGMWTTVGREEEGAGSTEGTSCMDDQGNIYFILKKNEENYLYKFSEGIFTRLGKAPAGIYHKLGYYNDQVYVSYLPEDYTNSYGQVKKWTGSSWTNVYTTKNPVDGNHIDFYGDENGLYIAYAEQTSSSFNNTVYGVIIDKNGTREIPIASNLQYGAYPSVHAEDGRVAIAFSEVFKNSGSNVRIAILEEGETVFEEISTDMRVSTLKMKLNRSSLYLLTTEQSGDCNFYSYPLNQTGAQWEKMGNAPFAKDVGPEYDFSFVRGNPHIIYMEGASPNAVYVTYLKDGVWTVLGDSIVQARVSGLRFFEFENRLYAAYVNTEETSRRAFVRSNRIEAPEIVIPDYHWAYGYHGSSEGGTELTLIPEVSLANIVSSLRSLPLEEGEIIEVIYEGDEENPQITGDLLDVVAEKGWTLQWYPKGKTVELHLGIQVSELTQGQSYEDTDLEPVFLETDLLPEEFKEMGSFRLATEGSVPAAGSWKILLGGNRLSEVFPEGSSLYQWEENQGELRQIRELQNEQENLILVPIAETAGTYVITAQGTYGWIRITESGKEFYRYTEHRSGEYVTGWEVVNGVKCYFDENGNLLEGIVKIQEETYLFGKMKEGEGYGILTGLQKVDGKEYYPDETGKLRTGWHLIENQWCHFSSEAENFGEKTAASENGYWITKGKNTYHYDFYGNVKKGYAPSGEFFYYFNNQGIPQSGWKKCEDRWRYFSPQAGEDFGKEIVTVSLGGGWYEKDSLNQLLSAEDTEGGTEPVLQEKERFYFVNDKTLASGWKTIAGKRYYFEKDGSCALGFTSISGKTYYFETKDTGKYALVTGEFSLEGKNYHADALGVLSTGWKEIAGKWKYFDSVTGEEKEVQLTDSGWARAGEDYFYLDKGKKAATGWKTLDGKKYYFAKDGKLTTGFFQVGKDWYYAFKEGNPGAGLGAMAVGAVSLKDSAGTISSYLFKSDGKLLTGWQKTEEGWSFYETEAGEDLGKKRESILSHKEGDYSWYRIGEDFYCFYREKNLVKQWKEIGGSRYYFDPATGVSYRGKEALINKKTYRFLEDGRMAAEGLYQDDTGKTYGYNKKGEKLFGWNQVNGEWKYFDLLTGEQEETAKVYSDYFAYATVNGVRNTYYLEKGKKLATGWKTIGDYKYYFDAKGVMQKQKTVIGKDTYFFAHNGKMRTGFVNYCDTVYYFTANGKMVTGWQKLNGEWMYFDESGILCASFVNPSGTVEVVTSSGKKKAFFGKAKKPATGWNSESGARIYYDSRGFLLEKGFHTISNKTYYMDENGVPRTGFFTIEKERTKTRYYFNPKGEMVKGWLTLNKKKYYFNPVTGEQLMGEQTIGGKRYYFVPSGDWSDENQELGTMASGYYREGTWSRYFNGSGVMQTGWQQVAGVWRYFDLLTGEEKEIFPVFEEAGTMETKEGIWKVEDSKRSFYSYFKKNKLQKGWQQINGVKYYFDSSTGHMAAGHLQIGGKWYYFEETGDKIGQMRTGIFETPENETYYHDTTGVRMIGWKLVENQWNYFEQAPSGNSSVPGAARRAEQTSGENTDKNNYLWLIIQDEDSLENGKIFCIKDGKTVLKGKQKINNKTFYFDTDGSLLRGKVWIGGSQVLLDESTGEMITN